MHNPNYDSSNEWERIPSHLLDLIFDKLKLARDYLQSGAVCQTWHSISKDNQIKRLASMPVDKQIPMLLVPDIENSDNSNTWRLFSITNNQFLNTKVVVPYNKRFCGSSRGWLVMINEDWSITLYNPFSIECQSISLPSLVPQSPEEFEYDYDYYIDKVLITADPLTNPDECAIIVTSWHMYNIACIRLTKDSAWTIIGPRDGIYITDFMYHGDHLYSINHFGEVHSFNLEAGPHNSTLNLMAPEDDENCAHIRRYIVDSNDGNAYLIRRCFEVPEVGSDDYIRETCEFKVYKLYLDGRNQNQKLLRSIGDEAIFLGDNHSICVKASNFNGCRRNCIYFTQDTDDFALPTLKSMISDLGEYNIETEEFQFDFSMDLAMLQAMKSRPPIWILPTLNS